MKKLLIALMVGSFAVAANAGYKRPYKNDRNKEVREVQKAVDRIENNKNSRCISNSGVQFNQFEPIQESNCGGTWTKKYSKNGQQLVRIEDTKCSIVIVGVKERGGYYSVDANDEGTRYYKLTSTKAKPRLFSATIRIPESSTDRGGDSVVLVTSGSGKSCAALPARF